MPCQARSPLKAVAKGRRLQSPSPSPQSIIENERWWPWSLLRSTAVRLTVTYQHLRVRTDFHRREQLQMPSRTSAGNSIVCSALIGAPVAAASDFLSPSCSLDVLAPHGGRGQRVRCEIVDREAEQQRCCVALAWVPGRTSAKRLGDASLTPCLREVQLAHTNGSPAMPSDPSWKRAAQRQQARLQRGERRRSAISGEERYHRRPLVGIGSPTPIVGREIVQGVGTSVRSSRRRAARKASSWSDGSLRRPYGRPSSNDTHRACGDDLVS